MTRAPLAAELSQMPPTPERRRAVYALWMTRTKTEVARLTGLSLGQVGADLRWCMTHDGKPRKGRSRADRPAPETETREGSDQGDSFARFRVASYVYQGERPTESVPQFTGAWRLSGDFLVLNDLHIPATNWAFADKALEVAEAHLPRPRKLIIAGDLINGDALSRWDDLVRCTPLADELDYARQWLNYVSATFDEIYVTRGNHENRVLLSMKGQLHAPQFWSLFSDNRRAHFSMYAYLDVISGGRRWHITHQRNYSQLPLSVARRMANKHGCSVICAHQHHSAVGRDVSNRYALIDSGGLHDSTKMAYVSLDDSTAPAMANGFVLLKNGVGTLFTPEDYGMTDWDVWLPRKAAAGRKAA